MPVWSSSSSLSSPYCPRCGAANCRSAGARDHFACLQCGAQFQLEQYPGQTVLRMQPSASEPSLHRLRSHWPWLLPALALVAAMPWWLPPLHQRVQSMLMAPEKGRAMNPAAWGRSEATTLVEHQGKRVVVQLYESREQDDVVYRVLLRDAADGSPVAEPQRMAMPWAGSSGSAELQFFSDGQLYLFLKERGWWRFDPGSLRFVDLLPQLSAKFAAELGEGIVGVAPQRRDRPDSLEVTTRSGSKYLVYWLLGQIWPSADSHRLYEKAQAGYGQETSYYRYQSLPRPTGEADRALLVQSWWRHEPGQPAYFGYFDLVLSSSPEVQSSPRSFVPVGDGYATRPYAINDRGLLRIHVVPPAVPRFHADVVAENARRLLLAYNPTPVRQEGRVIQLLDKANHQVVWSRTIDQLPQLGKREGGMYVTGQAVSGGFLLLNDMRQPALLLGDDGEVVQDFMAASGSRR
ncbi:hypothetical protein HS961_00925 [Comamonas piscis]|uniref:Uncharacterized protein n=1 Tax=Comamonas piscis TaxID=1562974 RepID=A0A7G5EBY6_9BURK|nr:hypothetical protein [Comamonas piscis]QMV71511.1 hypothetical protein HS961_00925 [Comamonas piscis]WSO34223.1 hypothetical protein VUJ63_00925 [Comamonas piscis]